MTDQWQPRDWMTPYPAPLGEDAYHGVLGDIVRGLAHQTEADPVGILASALVATGNLLGPAPAMEVSGKAHPARLFALLVGPTASRKGTAQGVADAVLTMAAPAWRRERRAGGLSSGEGLIRAVRDEVAGVEAVRDPKTKTILEYQRVVTDAGVDDKRLLVVEEEFGRALRAMQRDGNTLSEVLRGAFDGEGLSTLTKEALRATGAHISIAAHITPHELRQLARAVDLVNGLFNRFLFFAVRRARLLPRAGMLDRARVEYLGKLLGQIAEDAAAKGPDWRLDFDEAAYTLYERAYPALTREREGVLGGIISRGEVLVRRLALLYAALDLADAVGPAHLRAALAVWRYSEDTAIGLFGAGTGDTVMDTILAALAERARTQTEITNLFGRNIPLLDDTLELLEERGHIRRELVPTRGRPRTVWSLVRADQGAS
jgi:hypothetical protein